MNVKKSRTGFTLVELLMVASIFSLTVLLATTVFANIQTTQRGILGRQRVVADGRYILEVVTRAAKLGVPDYAYYANTAVCTNDHLGGSLALCNLARPQSVLAVRDQANVQTCYRWCTAASVQQPCSNGNRLQVSSNCSVAIPAWSDITPSDLTIDDFRVYIRPSGNPFRSPPSGPSDCFNSILSNYNATKGVCTCNVGGSDPTNCFPGQLCSDVDGSGSFICINPVAQPSMTVYMRTKSVTGGLGQSITSTLQTTVNSRVYRR